jgi:hypothetical protein
MWISLRSKFKKHILIQEQSVPDQGPHQSLLGLVGMRPMHNIDYLALDALSSSDGCKRQRCADFQDLAFYLGDISRFGS